MNSSWNTRTKKRNKKSGIKNPQKEFWGIDGVFLFCLKGVEIVMEGLMKKIKIKSGLDGILQEYPTQLIWIFMESQNGIGKAGKSLKSNPTFDPTSP